MTDQTQADHVPGETAPVPGQPMSDDAYLAMIDPPTADERPVDRAPEPEPAKPVERPSDGMDALAQASQQLAEASAAKREDAPQEPAAQPAKGDQYEAALRALRRWQVPKEVLANLTPEQVLEWGGKAIPVQEDVDKTYAIRREFESKAAPQAAPQARATPAAPAAEAEGSQEADHIAAVSTQAAELLGLDAKDGQVLDGVFRKLVEPFQRELAARNQRDGVLNNLVGNLFLRESGRRLEGMFPGLKDVNALQAVGAKAAALWKGSPEGTYQSFDDAFDDAARGHFFAQAQEASTAQANKLAQAKARSQPATPSPRTPPQALSQQDRESLFLESYESGMSESEAAAIAGY